MVPTAFISGTALWCRRELPAAWAMHVCVCCRGKKEGSWVKGWKEAAGPQLSPLLLCQAREGPRAPLPNPKGLSGQGIPRRPWARSPGEALGSDRTPGWQGPLRHQWASFLKAWISWWQCKVFCRKPGMLSERSGDLPGPCGRIWVWFLHFKDMYIGYLHKLDSVSTIVFTKPPVNSENNIQKLVIV